MVLDALGALAAVRRGGAAAEGVSAAVQPLRRRAGISALHVDNAIRIQRGSDFRIRSDLSATLFLDDPDEL